jgi:hypothetical protein
MTVERIVAVLNAEIARLEQAKKLLSSGANLASGSLAKGYRPNGRARKKRVLSPESRQRIAEAQRRRWAAQKKAVK